MHLRKQPKKMKHFFTFVFGLLLFSPGLSGVARGDLTSSTSEPVSSPGAINIVLSEWSVMPDKTSIQAGHISFSVRNEGPGDRHEFVVFKTDLLPDALPADSEGIDEKGNGLTLIGEIEDILVGAAPKTVSFELAPGNYVMVCNIWDASEQESHYHKGMRVKFTVTQSGAGIS